MLPSTLRGTELSAEEFRDSLALRYGQIPICLPESCDGCGNRFTVRHGLECLRGSMVIARNDEIRNELVDLGVAPF